MPKVSQLVCLKARITNSQPPVAIKGMGLAIHTADQEQLWYKNHYFLK